VTDNQQALEKLSKMPPEEQRLAHGIALWLNGYSISRSAKLADCPYSTLWVRLQKSQLMESDRVKFSALAEAQAMDLAGESHRLLREKLINPDEKLSAGELNMIWGTSIDKVTRLQQIGQRETEGHAIEGILSKIASAIDGKDLTLKIESPPPDRDAIDITPKPSNS